MMEERKRAPNFTINEKTLLLNLIHQLKDVIENKKTNSKTWREKDEAWEKITEMFNAQSPEIYPRSKEALKKYYDNIKKNVRKEVADEKREMFKTGGGTVQYVSNPVKELTLGLMNVKTVKGLSNEFDSDAVENIYDDEDKDLEEFEACEMPIDHTYSNGAPLGEQQQSTLSNVNHDLSSNKKNNFEPTGSKVSETLY
nr:unnamed protein product [Callosobruchus analis]